MVRLRAPAVGRLHSYCDVGFYSITNWYFPGDQKPFWKASFVSFPPRSSSPKISYGFKILTLECNFDQYWHFWSLCASCCFSEWFWGWRALCQRLQSSCHPAMIPDVAVCKSASRLHCLKSGLWCFSSVAVRSKVVYRYWTFCCVALEKDISCQNETQKSVSVKSYIF